MVEINKDVQKEARTLYHLPEAFILLFYIVQQYSNGNWLQSATFYNLVVVISITFAQQKC